MTTDNDFTFPDRSKNEVSKLKEVLHTQGELEQLMNDGATPKEILDYHLRIVKGIIEGELPEITMGEYRGEFYIRRASFDINGTDIAQMTTNYPVEQQKQFAELICKAVNERQRLIDSNRELTEILKELILCVTVNGHTKQTYDRAQTAINNAI